MLEEKFPIDSLIGLPIGTHFYENVPTEVIQSIIDRLQKELELRETKNG